MLISEAFKNYIQEELLLQNGAAKTAKNYLCALQSLIKAVGDIEVETLSRPEINQWVGYMQDAGNKPATQHSNLGRLRKVLRYLMSYGIETYDPNTIKSPKVHLKKPTVLQPEEVSALIDTSQNVRDRLLMSLLFSTGCRIAEALSINRGDIQGDHITVIGKNHKYRPVMLDERTKAYIDQYLATRDDDLAPLFITAQDTRMTVSRAQQIVQAASIAAGLEKKVTPHVFRHSFATGMMEMGGHIRVIQELLGHEHVTTTERYTHVSSKFLADSHRQYHRV